MADALAAAVARGVDVRLIVDAKENGTAHEAAVFPRDDNLELLADVPLPAVTLRQARASDIQHNKFMVLLRGGHAEEVWTGSTNISEGGIYGQANVGHWVRDPAAAGQFEAYWHVLAADPGGTRAMTPRRSAGRTPRSAPLSGSCCPRRWRSRTSARA